MITKLCSECGTLFTVERRARKQKKCQVCIAKGDERIKSVPVSRKCIFQDTVLVHSLPEAWKEMPRKRSHDAPYWKIDITGRDIADGWGNEPPTGRIVVNAKRPPQQGEVVKVRIMEAVHDTKDGSSEMRQYMSIEGTSQERRPNWVLSWQVGDWHPVPPGWEITETGSWENAVWGNGVLGLLSLTPIDQLTADSEPEQEEQEYEEEYEEYQPYLPYPEEEEECLLGEEALAKLRGGLR